MSHAGCMLLMQVCHMGILAGRTCMEWRVCSSSIARHVLRIPYGMPLVWSRRCLWRLLSLHANGCAALQSRQLRICQVFM